METSASSFVYIGKFDASPMSPPDAQSSAAMTSRRVYRGHVILSFCTGIFASCLILFLPYQAYLFLSALPSPYLLVNRDIQVSTKLFDRNGILLYQIYADQNRSMMPFSEIPDQIKKATIAIEDKNFYNHNGISLRGVIRAVWAIMVNKQIQGGSTITQQLIKSALLTPEPTIIRKIKEGILAMWAEHLYSKDQILEMYLNQVPYGHTAWGIETASRMYLGKSVKDISLAEAALLAGLPAAPSQYSPFGNYPRMAFERQHQVLDAMAAQGYITNDQRDAAKKQTISFAPIATNIRSPHFVMYVKDLLEKRFGSRLVTQGGLSVKTTLDLTIQERA
ncbi:penicillin-binding protein, partial [Candidatus Gottesmanbacteria bacterium]|nr:penicillin-binding protein [Candidatus Gottesmanbacteria bacterium]